VISMVSRQFLVRLLTVKLPKERSTFEPGLNENLRVEATADAVRGYRKTIE